MTTTIFVVIAISAVISALAIAIRGKVISRFAAIITGPAAMYLGLIAMVSHDWTLMLTAVGGVILTIMHFRRCQEGF